MSSKQVRNRVPNPPQKKRQGASRPRAAGGNAVQAAASPSARGPVLLSVRGDPFPIRMQTRLRYGQLFTLTAGASGLFGTEQVFRLASLFDPDLTGTGHQPYGFDTLATIYYRYKVIGVEVSLRFSDPSADGVIVAAQFQDPSVTATVTGSDPNTIMERPGMWTANVNNTGSQVKTLRQSYPMWMLAGVTPRQFDADIEDYQSLCTTNPQRSPFLRIGAAALDGLSTPTIRVQAVITFTTQFFERIILGQS